MRHQETDHERLEAMLGAFADSELEPEVEQSVAEHLAACEHCRRELQVQRLIAARIAAEPVEPAPLGFPERVLGNIGWNAGPAVRRPRLGDSSGRRRFLAAPWLGWAAAAAIAVAWVATSPPGQPAPGSSIALEPRIPMVEEALVNYRALEQQELPVQTRDPSQLQSRLPFPIARLSSRELTLLGAWITVIRGEQAAAVAYRWRNHVIVQYVVPEALFFRQPVVREAVAEAGLFSVARGSRSVVAWPVAGAGSLIVGDVPVELLERFKS